MISSEQKQYYLETGWELAGEYKFSWADSVDEFLFRGGDPRVLDNVIDVMKALNSGTTQSAVDLFNSQEHANADMELQFIKACHPSGQDFAFHIKHGKEIPGTYPARDENGNDLPHTMYSKDKTWRRFDQMIETFKQDELKGRHTCAWFNGRMYYSSTMDYNDPHMAMTGRPSPTKEEREAALQREREKTEAVRTELERRATSTAPQILSPEKYQEWQRFFADATNGIMRMATQCYALEVIEMVNRGDDLDDIRAHFNGMDLDRYTSVVAEFVERFSDDGQGLKKFLITGDRSELNISRDEGRDIGNK
jgi:hypothetical protein